MAANMESMPKFALRQLLATVVEKVVADMETKEIEIFLGLPSVGAIGQYNADNAMRLVGISASSTSDETHRRLVAIIADCSYVKHSSGSRYNCRRRRAA
jgi:hypothetical protein